MREFKVFTLNVVIEDFEDEPGKNYILRILSAFSPSRPLKRRALARIASACFKYNKKAPQLGAEGLF
ncbi:hypothetical protein [Hymenobacter roseosalivarius]|uniref:hypothetical protein n=1 Tax=Hymenobacter roseosalivarius TaxID=89967 RepID=UPI00117B6EFB|nr:hypothetical protein [Hymenobacter roseosalivarius]